MMRLSVLVGSACAAVLLFAVVPEARSEEKPKTDKLWVFIGTYTGAKSKGIYRSEFDPATGKLTAPELVAEMKNPTFLAIHPTQKFLYAVGEVASISGKKGGGVSAYGLDAKTGKLTALNEQSSVGAGPCYVAVDRVGKNALVAIYGGGSVAVLPISADGKLASGKRQRFNPATAFGFDPEPAVGAASYSINVDAADRFAIAADLNLDKLLVYKLDSAKGTLTPNDPPFLATAPGAGPRHFAFHPNGKWAYVINEMNMTLVAMTYDADKGILKPVQAGLDTADGRDLGKGFLDGGGGGASVGQVRLRLQPRPEQYRRLQDRRENRRTDADRPSGRGHQDAAQLQHRPERQVHDRLAEIKDGPTPW